MTLLAPPGAPPQVGIMFQGIPLDMMAPPPADAVALVNHWRIDLEDDGGGLTSDVSTSARNGLSIASAELTAPQDGQAFFGLLRACVRGDVGVMVLAVCPAPQAREWLPSLTSVLDTLAEAPPGAADNPPWITWRDEVHGVELRAPQDWARAPRPGHDAPEEDGERVVIDLKSEDGHGLSFVRVALHSTEGLPPGEEPEMMPMGGGDDFIVEIERSPHRLFAVAPIAETQYIMGGIWRHHRPFWIDAGWVGGGAQRHTEPSGMVPKRRQFNDVAADRASERGEEQDALVRSILSTLRFSEPRGER
jgi:hypothetical protein